ncbi:MAG TPA: hypothetical protein PLN61_12050 [bacterium]|nr:hypothetical protein [bacterium]HQI49381.1 hypothetical protein [bacterium]HQJ66243.1 hypothetical protein [bacterium]
MNKRMALCSIFWAVQLFPALGFSQGLDPNKYHGGSYDGYASASYVTPADSMKIVCAAGWNMISSAVAPRDPTLSVTLTSISAHLVIMKDGAGRVYWPAYNIAILHDWSVPHGYLVYLTARDTLIIVGRRVSPGNTPLGLNTGWNMVSYLSTLALNPSDAFATIASYLVIAKNGLGQVYWPAYNVNTIGSMTAGAGYQLYVSQSCTLSYPANQGFGKSSALPTAVLPIPQHFSGYPNNSSDNAILLIEAPGLPDKAEVGAWSSGRLVSAGVVQSGKAIMTLWGDNPCTDEMDGAAAGALITLTCWIPGSNQEKPLPLTRLQDGLRQIVLNPEIRYQSNALWLAETAGQSILPNDFALSQNFPNPFNPSTTLRFHLPQQVYVDLCLFNLTGIKVKTLVKDLKQPGYHEMIWDGQDDLGKAVPSGVYWLVMKAGRYQKCCKITLIR